MKIIAFFFVLIVILLIALVVYAVYLYFANDDEEHGEWSMRQRSLPGRKVGIFLISPTGNAEIFGEPISNKLPEYEFQDRIEELRVGAEARVETLNRKMIQ